MNLLKINFLQPDDSLQNARPLLEVVDYDAKFDKVVQSITANVIVVRALDQSARDIRNEQYDVVTADGDQMSKKGVMTGGFIDKKRSKLEIHSKKMIIMKELSVHHEQLKLAEQNVRDKTRAAEQVRNRMTQNENQISDFHRRHRELTEAKNAISQQFFMIAKTKEPKMNQLIQIRNRLRELVAQKEILEQEIGSAMSSQLTDGEQQSVRELRVRFISFYYNQF